jgi:hypothetical protein
MPQPARHESLNNFVARFMGSKEAQKTFPRNSQRAAVAYSEFRGKKRK